MNLIIQKVLDKSGKNISSKRLRFLTKDDIEWIEKRTSFLPQEINVTLRIKCIMNGISSIPLCACGKHVTLKPADFHRTCGSTKCFITDETIEKRRITNLQRYGVDNPMMSKDIQEKSRKTCLEKYGKETVFQSDLVKEKIKTTVKIRYGVESISQLSEIKTKKIETFRQNKTKFDERIRERYIIKYKQLLDTWNKTQSIQAISDQFDISFHHVYKILGKLGVIFDSHTTSSVEKSIHSMLNTFDVRYITNDRTVIKPKELDIYFPSHNLGIEINGVYWHNDTKKDKNHMLKKTDKCLEKNVRLLHFFDVEIMSKPKIVESIIRNALGIISNKIYARKCKIVEITSKEAKEFCDENHISGGVYSKINKALKYDGKIVSVLCVSKSRFEKNTLEVIRFCSLLNTNVVGGLSKLLSSFEQDLISYVDLRFHTGNGYQKAGFVYKSTTPPNYYYVHKKGSVLESRMKYQKHKLKHLSSYSEDKTESQIMMDEGYFRVYDCGNKKYGWKKSTHID